ncbi:MAG: hypothetical protein WAM82_11650 [Thermoanaerobaculia bacterium]
MSYLLQAIIGRGLEQPAAFRTARVVPIAQSLVMIPLTNALYDEIGRGERFVGFEKLSARVEEWASLSFHRR